MDSRSVEATESFEIRLQRVVRQVLDTRIELLAIMMVEAGVEPELARERLSALVRALRAPEVEKTIFENGRRMATQVVEDRIVLNSELLSRVGDSEVLTALARPVAQITELASVGVSLAFQIDDDQLMRDLTMKAQRRVGLEVVRASSIPEWVRYRLDTMAERVVLLCAELGEHVQFDADSVGDLRDLVASAPVWPEWADVSDAQWCKDAVSTVASACTEHGYGNHAEMLVELLWDSVVLSTQSFLRHAGRSLRPEATKLDLCATIEALAKAVSGDEHLAAGVSDWSAFQDVAEIWVELNHEERALFGNSRRGPVPEASVLEAAALAFGMDEPTELPWKTPLVCWTTREQRALRDLLAGLVKLMPGRTDAPQAVQGHVPMLDVSGPRRSMQLQVVPIGSEASLATPLESERAFEACVREIIDRFRTFDPMLQDAAFGALRGAYDEWFPSMRELWNRRLYSAGFRGIQQFEELVTAVNDLFGVPALFDPFAEPGSGEFLPVAGLVFPVGIGDGPIAMSLPVVALTATQYGGPLNIRVVDTRGECRWLCDRALHLNSLSQQPVDQMMRSIRRDSVQLALTPA